MYFDPLYTIYILPGLILAIAAQIWITTSFNKYSKLPSGKNITGVDAANIIKEGESFPVSISVGGEKLSDHFDPRRDIVNISQSSLQDTVSSIAVVVHEFGHVQQKFSKSHLFIVRSALVPIVNIGSRLGYILIILGLILNLLGMAQLGLILFASTTLFAFVTLRVEIDASRRAMKLIKKYDLIPESRIGGAKTVLGAAATTYLASLLTSLLNLFYYASLVLRRD
jgi:Zn-dependent membrane protease YugP